MELNNVPQYFEKKYFILNNLILRLIPYYRQQHHLMLNIINIRQ